jgi:flagellar hook protein FlgE
MLRSMFAAVSGLQAHQTFMDVVGNNIANVNTTGFKSGTVQFEDLLSQTINGAGSPSAGVSGGTNPAQVGLGVRLAGIGTNFSQGASQQTGRQTDFAIQGDGFFVVNQGGIRAYTRNGSFSLDGLGQLVTGDGGLLQGWQADPNGNVNTNSSIGPLKIPVGETIAPITTGTISIGGNLPSDTATGGTVNISIDVNNSLGGSIPLRMQFTKVADTAGSVNWTVTTFDSANNVIAGPSAV